MYPSSHWASTVFQLRNVLALVEDIWDSIAADSAALPLTDAQRAELDRRLADHETNPDDVVPWEELRGSITERLKR